MILSFHPCYAGDTNILCAGRKPNEADLAAIQSATEVILPQGCMKPLYDMARHNCAHVFPNYDARFAYPGKTGQIALFEKTGVLYPKTEVFQSVESFHQRLGNHSPNLLAFEKISEKTKADTRGFVFKFDWGGEGENVFYITSPEELTRILHQAVEYERTGQNGFLIQEYIPSGGKSLRVAVIGQQMISYWRIQKQTQEFYTNLSHGASIDYDADPELQSKAIDSVRDFCHQTGINLAGFDLLFSENDPARSPIFLEINYFFGRTGLGGSNQFYIFLIEEINRWLEREASESHK